MITIKLPSNDPATIEGKELIDYLWREVKYAQLAIEKPSLIIMSPAWFVATSYYHHKQLSDAREPYTVRIFNIRVISSPELLQTELIIL